MNRSAQHPSIQSLAARLVFVALSAGIGGGAIAQSAPSGALTQSESPVLGQVAQAGPGAPMVGQGPRMGGPGGSGGPGGQMVPGGPGMHRGGPRGPEGHHGGPRGHGMRDGGMGLAGPAMMLLGRGQDRALELVQATPQQRADIRRIAGAARDDLRKARQDSRPRREAWAAAWTADRIDAAALEAERARMAAQRDATGKRMVQAMVDVGAVLQPEQRRLLAEHWARHGGQRRAEFMNLDEHAQALVD